MRYSRITMDLDQMGGVPCIRGLRIPVTTIVIMIAEGMSMDEILNVYPDLEKGGHPRSFAFRSGGSRGSMNCPWRASTVAMVWQGRAERSGVAAWHGLVAMYITSSNDTRSRSVEQRQGSGVQSTTLYCAIQQR